MRSLIAVFVISVLSSTHAFAHDNCPSPTKETVAEVTPYKAKVDVPEIKIERSEEGLEAFWAYLERGKNPSCEDFLERAHRLDSTIEGSVNSSGYDHWAEQTINVMMASYRGCMAKRNSQ